VTTEDAQLVLVIKGNWLSAGGLQLIRGRTDAALANYYPDDPFNHPGTGWQLAGAAPKYDRFYTFAHSLVPRLISLGARARFLPFAWDPDLHPAPAGPVPHLCDLSFVGNWSPERVPWLEHLVSFDLGLWGHWRRLSAFSPLRGAVRGGPVLGVEMGRVMRGSPLTINLIRIVSNGHNMRSFETLGVGACLLSNRTPELVEMFKEDREVIFFDTPFELLDKVRFYLSHPHDPVTIAAAGARRVQHETYFARARSILADFSMDAA
jgi:hypothetical protein